MPSNTGKLRQLDDYRWAVIDPDSGRALAVTREPYYQLPESVKEELIEQAKHSLRTLRRLKPRTLDLADVTPRALRYKSERDREAADCGKPTKGKALDINDYLGDVEAVKIEGGYGWRREGHKRGPPLKEPPLETYHKELKSRWDALLESCEIDPRHLKVMRMTAERRTNKEIAAATGYTIRQINNIRAKYRRP